MRGTLRWARADLRARRGQALTTIAVVAAVVAALFLAIMLLQGAVNPWQQLFARTRGADVLIYFQDGTNTAELRHVAGIHEMSTPYQAVLLTNGSAYFGKLQGLGTPFPVLTDVFYVQSSQNPDTKQVSNILVKRGKEWHQPDRMILNSNMIVLVEPVSPGSRVAQLIAEAH